MRIKIRNIDGSELARWTTWNKEKFGQMPDISRPSFNLLPNSDERCPYVIEFEDGPKTEMYPLATKMPLNLAIDIAIHAYNEINDPLVEY
jgi:hypothetical protein